MKALGVIVILAGLFGGGCAYLLNGLNAGTNKIMNILGVLAGIAIGVALIVTSNRWSGDS